MSIQETITNPTADIIRTRLERQKKEQQTLQRISSMIGVFDPEQQLLRLSHLFRQMNLPLPTIQTQAILETDTEPHIITAFRYRIEWNQATQKGAFYFDTYSGNRVTIQMGQIRQGFGLMIYGGGTLDDSPKPDNPSKITVAPFETVTPQSLPFFENALRNAMENSAWITKGTLRPPIRL